MDCNYEKKCLGQFIIFRQHYDCKIRFEIFSDIIKIYYYYNDDELFDVDKDINILRQFLKKCKFNSLNWLTTAEIGIDNSQDVNYSQLVFNRSFKFLTRLDIKRR